MFRLISAVFVFLIASSALAQVPNLLEKLPVPDFIDTLFIDHDINNWSLRVFTNYKDHRFQVHNKDDKVSYKPNNPVGIGIGLASRKIILDLGFNIKTKTDEPTDRFDLHASLSIRNHLISGFLQSYQGFNLKEDVGTNKSFRNDIESFAIGINYIYLFNAKEYSFMAMKSGLSKQKRTAFSFGLGGFLYMNNMRADSSIIPSEMYPGFNRYAQIIHLRGIGGGVLGGFGITVPFMEKFFFSSSFTPGIGLMHKKVQTDSETYYPRNPLIIHSALEGLVGYNSTRFYINGSLTLALYHTDLDYDNNANYGTINAKFAIGYKLGQARNKPFFD